MAENYQKSNLLKKRKWKTNFNFVPPKLRLTIPVLTFMKIKSSDVDAKLLPIFLILIKIVENAGFKLQIWIEREHAIVGRRQQYVNQAFRATQLRLQV